MNPSTETEWKRLMAQADAERDWVMEGTCEEPVTGLITIFEDPDDEFICPSCNGTGEDLGPFSCHDCHGTGVVPDPLAAIDDGDWDDDDIRQISRWAGSL